MRLVYLFLTIFILSFEFFYCSTTRNNIELSKQTDFKATTTSLTWKPNVLEQDFNLDSLELFRDLNICIKPFTDSRESIQSIGTINQGDQLKTIIPNKNITEWCAKSLVSACRFLGLKAVNKSCTYSLEGEIINISIHQDVTLHGKIKLSLSFHKDGLTVWEGTIEAASELYLVPSGSDGVSECLSNTLIGTTYNLLNDKSLIDAISKSKE